MDIINIVENELGIKDVESYKVYLNNLRERGYRYTKEEVDLLNPEKIDNVAFWKYAYEKFPNTVCGEMWDKVNPLKANELNRNLAIGMGYHHYINMAIQAILRYKDANNLGNSIDLLEIGPGFGYLKKDFPDVNYTGIDVCPQFDGVVEYDGKSIPDEIKNKQFDLVVSCNVFQHMTINQRRMWHQYAKSNSLAYIVALTLKTLSMFTEKIYVNHFGQLTEMQDFYSFRDDLCDSELSVRYTVSRGDNMTLFYCLV